MDKAHFIRYITEQYGVEAEYPWVKSPDSAVFRHQSNRKWFALMMDIPRCKLGFSGSAVISVLNVKCDPLFIGSIRENKGVFPAYHMNKSNWVTIALDGSASQELIEGLLEMSYTLTRTRVKQKRNIDADRAGAEDSVRG